MCVQYCPRGVTVWRAALYAVLDRLCVTSECSVRAGVCSCVRAAGVDNTQTQTPPPTAPHDESTMHSLARGAASRGPAPMTTATSLEC